MNKLDTRRQIIAALKGYGISHALNPAELRFESKKARKSGAKELQFWLAMWESLLFVEAKAWSQARRSAETVPPNKEGELIRESLLKHASGDRMIKIKFSPNEKKLLQFLHGSKGRSRAELVEKLWGKEIDPFVGENRLKNLLARIREKNPGLIAREAGLYKVQGKHPF